MRSSLGIPQNFYKTPQVTNATSLQVWNQEPLHTVAQETFQNYQFRDAEWLPLAPNAVSKLKPAFEDAPQSVCSDPSHRLLLITSLWSKPPTWFLPNTLWTASQSGSVLAPFPPRPSSRKPLQPLFPDLRGACLWTPLLMRGFCWP